MSLRRNGPPEDHFVYLLASLLLLLVAAPFLFEPIWGRILLSVIGAAALLAATQAVSRRRSYLVISMLLLAPALGTHVAATINPTSALALTRSGFAILFYGFTLSVMLASLLRGGRVTTNTIYGAICVYLLLGLTWAALFTFVELVSPGAVRSSDNGALLAAEGLRAPVTSDFLYFSFVTLTTLGYGDMVPASRVTRMLAVLEAITGQIYLAILVARLVGLHIAGPRHGESE